MSVKKTNFLIGISVIIYILACFMPAYVEARDLSAYIESPWTEYSDYPGWGCLLDGIMFPLALLSGSFGTSVWIANVFYFCALITSFYSIKRKWSVICALISIIIGSSLMFFTLHYVTKDYFCWIFSLLSGYYLWLLSFITLFIGLLTNYLRQNTKRWFSLIYCLCVIPVCACIIVHTYDKGDNSIMLNDESQSLVAKKTLDALIIDDGTNKCLIKRQENCGSAIALKDIYSSFSPADCKSAPIEIKENNIYEIHNATYVRVPQQKNKN